MHPEDWVNRTMTQQLKNSISLNEEFKRMLSLKDLEIESKDAIIMKMMEEMQLMAVTRMSRCGRGYTQPDNNHPRGL